MDAGLFFSFCFSLASGRHWYKPPKWKGWLDPIFTKKWATVCLSFLETSTKGVLRKLLPPCTFSEGLPPVMGEWWASKRYVHLESVTVTLLGKRVFADAIKSRIPRWDHSGLAWAPNPMTGVLFRGSQREDWDTREGHVKTEAELEVCGPKPTNAKGNHQKSGERQQVLPHSLPKEPTLPSSITMILNLWLTELCGTKPLLFKTPGLWHLSQQPWQTNTCHWARFLVPSSFRTKRESCLMSRRYPVSKNLMQVCRTLCLYPTAFMKKGQKLLGAVQVHLGLV